MARQKQHIPVWNGQAQNSPGEQNRSVCPMVCDIITGGQDFLMLRQSNHSNAESTTPDNLKISE
jgi:hypothetical protein